jgi:hypothetical protein
LVDLTVVVMASGSVVPSVRLTADETGGHWVDPWAVHSAVGWAVATAVLKVDSRVVPSAARWAAWTAAAKVDMMGVATAGRMDGRLAVVKV